MSKNKIKELIICLVALTILALTITTNIFATDLNALAGDLNNTDNFAEVPNNTAQGGNVAPNNVPVNNVVNNTTNNDVAAPVNNASANNTNSTVTPMPDAGLDNSVIVIIAICGISAVYAYKKISEYKNV